MTTSLNIISAIKVIEIEKMMTSLELVELINKVREEEFERGKTKKFTKLQHSDFTKKVPLVLGKEAARKFFGTDTYKNGTGGTVTREIYKLPERESWLMAMSYSYTLQAYIYDKMTEAFKCNHSVRMILDRYSAAKYEVHDSGSTWGRMGIEQKKNKRKLQQFFEDLQGIAQLDLFTTKG